MPLLAFAVRQQDTRGLGYDDGNLGGIHLFVDNGLCPFKIVRMIDNSYPFYPKRPGKGGDIDGICWLGPSSVNPVPG